MKVIRNKNDHDEFWSTEDGWVSRENADEYPADQQTYLSLPPNGEWVGREMGLSYKIMRCYKDPNKEREFVKGGLSWEEAREHCSDPSTQGDGWFDAFYEE